jgi:hypothetical protein
MLALAACGGSSEPKAPTAHTITGTFTLLGQNEDSVSSDYVEGEFISVDGGCAGTGRYDDIEAGLQVTVSNETGTVIGTGALGQGTEVDAGCEFPFTVGNVPVAKFYKVEVGRRGTVNYSYADMEAASWKAELSLGD